MSSVPPAPAATPATGEGAALVGALATVVIWGSYFPGIDFLLQSFDPYTLSITRSLLAAAALLGLLWLREGAAGFAGTVPWPRLVLLGSFGSGSLVLLFTLAIDYAGPVTAALVACGAPVITAVVARIGFGERLGPRMRVAIALAVLGALAMGGGIEPGASLGGALVMVFGYASWSWYLCAAQRWLGGWSQLRITSYTMSMGALVATLVYTTLRLAGVVEGRFGTAPAELAVVLYLSVVGIALASWMWNNAVNRLGVNRASVIGNLVPVVAVLLSVATGAAWPGAVESAGALLILAGIVYAQSGTRRHDELAEAAGITRPFATRRLWPLRRSR